MNTQPILQMFNGSLSEGQQNGVDIIINEWSSAQNSDIRHLAYILATIFHETGRKMQPVKEFGSEAYLKSKKYYPYYGRDLVQTTWVHNYQKVKDFSGIDVISNPELIGQMPLAAQVAVTFMSKGLYTGKKLVDYFNNTREDAYNARRIINGLDCANKIVAYYKSFLASLK